MTPKDLYFILEQGIKAPSADNLQPWKFEIQENGSVYLILDASKITSYCDAGNLAPYIAAGAAIENMRVAATRTGHETLCRYFPDPSDPLRVAHLYFKPGLGGESRHLLCLEKRHTNRKFYDTSKSVDRSDLSALERFAPREEGFRLLWKTRSDAGYRELANVIGESDQLRFEIKRLHQELMQVIRFDETSAQETRDGLPLPALEAGPSAPLMFPLIRSWNRLNWLNRIGMSLSFNLYARFQMLSSAAAGLLVSEGSSPYDFVRGGEIMERIWLETCLHGLALQPMEALPIFLINTAVTGGPDLNARQKLKVDNLGSAFRRIYGVGPQNGLILFFRIGYAAPPEHRSASSDKAAFRPMRPP